jgi:NAD(P)-dependent dehydrogenase (short-subunit alcohol dehydrogenase family)
MRLQGKVVLITGSGKGLGRAASLLCAREGALVAGCGRTRSDGEETVRLVEEEGGKAVFVQADVAVAADVQRVVDEVMQAHGRIDVLVNNASILFAGTPSMECLETTEQLTGSSGTRSSTSTSRACSSSAER